MQIAIVQNGVVTQVGDYQSLFPNTSFPNNGPDDAFLTENSAKKVNRFKSYDNAAEKLVYVEPYVDGEFVCVVTVQALTEEELAAS